MTNNDAVDRRRLAGAVSDIIHRGASTGKPRFDAGRLTTQQLRHHEPDAAQGEEARHACATWPGPPGSNRMQQSN